MNPSLNLYPANIQAQCVCAITQLDEQISALNVLKGSISEFVNDSSIHSVSFDQLKSQCRNYPDVIDAMIYCNEADKADFVTLQGSVGNENLIGADIDKWERYYEQKREEAREKRKMAPLQMAAYFDTLIQMYTELYNLWYAKELAYYEIDGKTSTLFAKSYGRQANSNLLSALKDSFKLEEGYNSSVVAAQAIKVKNAMTGSMQMEPEVMAAWDALLRSGKTYSEAEKIITDLRLNNPEILDKINHVISSAGYEYAVNNFESYLNSKINIGEQYSDNIRTYNHPNGDTLFITNQAGSGYVNHCWKNVVSKGGSYLDKAGCYYYSASGALSYITGESVDMAYLLTVCGYEVDTSDCNNFVVSPQIVDLGNIGFDFPLIIDNKNVKNTDWGTVFSNCTGYEVTQKEYCSTKASWEYPQELENVCYIVRQSNGGNGPIDTTGNGHWVCIYPIGEGEYEVINHNGNGKEIISHDELIGLNCTQYELRW